MDVHECINNINKINPNLSLFESGAPGKAGQSSGISPIKSVTRNLRRGYCKSHPTFVSSSSQNHMFFLLLLLRQALITTHT